VPGVVHQTGTYQRMTFGELDGRLSERGQRLRELCETAGFEGVLSPDVRIPIWEKFLLLVPLSGLHALTRVPLGRWRGDSDLLALYEAALRETVAVGLAQGVQLPPDCIERTLEMMWSMPAHHTTSMGNDLARGNRLELPWFAGKVVELGRRHDIPTPVNTFIYTALKPHIKGTPF
jgi:2-dehydropantoate 2-reductase